jgi:Protein of unknown function (DUF1552)
MKKEHLLSRRTVLKGLGVTLALPWLEQMGMQTSWAAGNTPVSQAAPNRMAFLYVPNGVNMDGWRVPTEGALPSKLPAILEPLAEVKDYFSVLSGLTADKARAHGDGGGDHARAMSAFLTGAQPRKTDGANIKAGVSADQIAAARIGARTRLASLEIGADASKLAGGCDSGYSCIYESNLSWRSATQPMPKEISPKLIFERLFGSGSDVERARRDAARKSILDSVRDDFRELNVRLGTNDQRKLDEYFTAVRELEVRIQKAGTMAQPKLPATVKAPTGIPQSYEEHLRLLADLMVLAFQTDSTRVCTFVLANEGSNRSYSFINVRDGHHSISHHGHDPVKLAKIQDINKFHASQLAYLLTRLKSVKEGDGNLLDHSMIVYGSGNGDGDRHNHDDLPILLAGRGCGTLRQGRSIQYAKETPINNLWVSMLNRMDIHDVQFGDSTGELKKLV